MPKINTDPEEFPVEEADLKDRMSGFNNELRPLLGKYELGLAAIPRIIGDGRISADPVIVSVRKKNVDLPANESTGSTLENPEA